MSSREHILSRIKGLANSRVPQEEREQIVNSRISDHPRGIIPEQTRTREALSKRFAEKVKSAAGSVESCKGEDLPKVVADYLRKYNLPAKIRVGEDKRLQSLHSGSMLEVVTGASDGNDLTCVSHAVGGVAESGTLFLASGPKNPTTLNFLPEHHIVVVNESSIMGSYEELLGNVRKAYGSGKMPRALNMITGPSRSGDIEQTLILGAHGPLALHVVVVKD